MNYNQDQTKEILNIYSELCGRKKNRVDKTQNYERIPYDEWNLIKSAKFINVEAFIGSRDYITIVVTAMPADKDLTYHAGGYEERTFGDFLLKVVQGEYDNRIMPTEDKLAGSYDYKDFCAMLDDASIYTSSAVSGTYLADNYDITLSNKTLATTPPSNATKITTIDRNYYTTADTIITGTYSINDSVTELSDRVAALETKINNKKEGKENMKGFKFDFGTCEKDNVRVSMYGLAIQNAEGTWVSYDVKNNSIIDVDLLNIDCRKYMFKLPVAIKDIKIGDIIIHNRKPMFVTSVKDGIKVVDVHAGEAKEIMLTKSMFGFDFATKVVSMFDFGSVNASADSPFGNMLPLLLMSEGEKNINPMMLYMMMQQQGNSASIDPMMMMLMMGDDNKDMLPLMFMMNQNRPAATPAATPSTVTE